jgi:uncharacterized protein YdaU (DUF1376 family)
MNWYPRFPGDYIRDTAHLSLVEHGVYNVLLDHYYATGLPLPVDVPSLMRICRAFEDHERKAVAYVVDVFFPVAKDGKRHNKRADKQLAEMCEKHEKLSRAGKDGMAKRWKGKSDKQVNKVDNKEAIAYPHPQPHPHTISHKPEPESDILGADAPACAPPKINKPKPKTFKNWTAEEFLAECNRIHESEPVLDDYEASKFYAHWTQLDGRGKLGVNRCKTWNTKLRMVTWRDNQENWRKGK